MAVKLRFHTATMANQLHLVIELASDFFDLCITHCHALDFFMMSNTLEIVSNRVFAYDALCCIVFRK